jgi:VanZ family protein
VIYNKIIQIIVWSKPKAKYLLAAWIITIICVSSIPSIPTLKIHTSKTDIRLDYLIHICEYAFLALLALLSFTGDDFKMTLKRTFIISVSLILFAIIDEFHQKLIPGRAFNVNDIISNILGILAALVFCIILFRKLGQNHKKKE